MIQVDTDEIEKRVYVYQRQNYVIYSIINLNNGKRYIGRTRNPRSRIKDHISSLKRHKHSNPFINKDSYCNFGFEILEEGIDFKHRAEKERQYILWYRTYDERYGYNLNDPCLKSFRFETKTG